MDAQSAAFREAAPADRVPDGRIHDHAERVHNPILDVGVLKTPEDYEAEGWDTDRLAPKGRTEARRQLAARIADRAAPDGPEVAGAYDTLEGGS